MKYALYDGILFLFVLFCFIAQSILLIIRLDLAVPISYFIILIPTYLVVVAITIYGVFKITRKRLGWQRLSILVIAFVIIYGIAVSQILFGFKFQNIISISVFECYIPIFISSGISLFIGLVVTGKIHHLQQLSLAKKS